MNTARISMPPKLPIMDMTMKSVSDIKRNYSKIVKEVMNNNEPAFVMNHNVPESVLMSYAYYREIIVETRNQINAVFEEIARIEDERLAQVTLERLQGGSDRKLTMAEVFGGEADETNLYATMNDEELFD